MNDEITDGVDELGVLLYAIEQRLLYGSSYPSRNVGCAVSECDGTAGHIGGAGGNGVGDRKSATRRRGGR
jgi:hypothetical protein